MSKLLESGFNPAQVAKLASNLEVIKNVNRPNRDSVMRAINALTDMHAIVAGKIGTSSYDKFMNFCKVNFNLDFALCRWHEERYPLEMLVAIPDGRGSYARADLLLQTDWDWAYAENGNVIKTSRLYGTTNILSYTADPLQYLKFRCLPEEKLTYTNKDDVCCNDEYSGVAPVFLGIELEVEKREKCPNKIEHMVAADLGMDYMVLKSDSSIQNGFEIVTAPATIGFHLKAWDRFFDTEKGSSKHLTSWTSGRCGMHVHIGRSAFTPMHLGKFFAFINNNENREFITSIGGRNSHFSKFIEDKSFHVKSKLVSHMGDLYKKLKATTIKEEQTKIEKEMAIIRAKLTRSTGEIINFIQNTTSMKKEERHSAVNLAKQGTVEVRIFRGNIMKVGMLKNLEFVHAAVEFTREATFRTHALTPEEMAERKLKRKEYTDYALHYTYFLDWLQNDDTGNYNNLKQWLQTHKMTDKFAKKKVSSKVPPDKRITDDDIRACA